MIDYSGLVALVENAVVTLLSDYQFYDDETANATPAVVMEPGEPTIRYGDHGRGEWSVKITIVGGQMNSPGARARLREFIHPRSELILALNAIKPPGGYVLVETASLAQPYQIGSIRHAAAAIVLTAHA